MKKMVLIIIAAVILVIAALYAYMGGFSSLNVHVDDVGGETVVYKEVTGDYAKITPVTDEVYYYLLNELGIETYKGFGIFYDNPQKVAKDKQRADAGCIIEPEDLEKLAASGCKYSVKQLPVEKAVLAQLPFRGPLSTLMGFIRVFPAIDKYRSKHHLPDGPVITIVDVPDKKITYRKILKGEM